MTDGEPETFRSISGNADPAVAEVEEGLSWSWNLDFESLIAALSEPAPWNRPPPTAVPAAPPEADASLPDADSADTEPTKADSAKTVDGSELDPVEAEFADYLDAVDEGRTSVFPLSVAAGRVAEILPASPDLAAWLACNPARGLEDGALPGVAAAYRRLASWAQAGELAAVAQMASRSAAADKKNGIDENGRPDKIPADAYGQVSLALTMSQAGAEWWTDLAVNLQWRLAATGTALGAGTIDLPRAKAIAEATAPLDDDKAQAVEAKILSRAGEQTIGQLRASLRRAVITADPEGAERRREEAEKRAKVTLYPDAEGTASLSGQNLPGIRAAAAMARITALARALKAAGAGGGIDLLRSKVLLGLLLGTLPHIPPPADGPGDADGPPGGDLGSGPGRSGPGGSDGSDTPEGSNPLLEDWPWDTDPVAGNDPTAPEHSPPDKDGPGNNSAEDNSPDKDSAPSGDDGPDDDSPDDDSPDADGSPDWQPSDPGDVPGDLDGGGERAWAMPWPEATPVLPPGPAITGDLIPAGSGFLELRLPWPTLARHGPEPGCLTRLGPVTPAQARYLAGLAARDPAVQWRVVLTDPRGRATAVTRARPRRSPPGPPVPGSHSSLVRQVTVTVPETGLALADHGGPAAEPNLAAVLTAVITAARDAAAQAAERAAADAAAGGCAHTRASPAYQAPARLREYVTVRDLTCRFPTCRQPAWRCDLDHTQPHDQDGPTCPCNLGALCRHHHRQLKQHPRWRLDQPQPGTFTWTTPAGRTYTTQPDPQAA